MLVDGLWGVDGCEHWDEVSQHHEGITRCLYGELEGPGSFMGWGGYFFLGF